MTARSVEQDLLEMIIGSNIRLNTLKGSPISARRMEQDFQGAVTFRITWALIPEKS